MRMLFSVKVFNVFVCVMMWVKLMYASSLIVIKFGSGMGGFVFVGYK